MVASHVTHTHINRPGCAQPHAWLLPEASAELAVLVVLGVVEQR